MAVRHVSQSLEKQVRWDCNVLYWVLAASTPAFQSEAASSEPRTRRMVSR
jgi:hypothetical protein